MLLLSCLSRPGGCSHLLCGEQHPPAQAGFSGAEPRFIPRQSIPSLFSPPSPAGSPGSSVAGSGRRLWRCRPAGSGVQPPPERRGPLSDLSRPGPLPLRQHVPAPCPGALPDGPGPRPAPPWQQPGGRHPRNERCTASLLPSEPGPGVCLRCERVWQPVHGRESARVQPGREGGRQRWQERVPRAARRSRAHNAASRCERCRAGH